MSYVIGNADRETVNRFGSKTVVEHGLDHARGKLFGRQTVTAADNFRHVGDFAVGESLSQRGNDVKVQRFADRTGFLGTVKGQETTLTDFGKAFRKDFSGNGRYR